MIKRLIILILMPLSSIFAGYFTQDLPPNFSITVELPKDHVQFHEPLEVNIHVTYPEGHALFFQNISELIQAHGSPNFTLIAQQLSEPQTVDGSTSQTLSYQLEIWSKDELFVPLPIVHFADTTPMQQTTLNLFPDLTPITILAPDQHDTPLENASILPFSEKSPIEMGYSNKKHLVNEEKSNKELERNQQLLQKKPIPWKRIFLTTCLILALLLIYRQVRKLSKKPSVIDEYIDPHKKALEALQLLEKEGLPQKGLFEDFYVRITQIIRHYIEDQYNIKAPERTTQEFLNEVIQVTLFEENMKHHLADFLKFADLVKFAQLHPEEQDCNKAIDAAHKFLKGHTQSV